MHSSVVIVGGGVMGCAIACFLARDHRTRVTVIERDPRYLRASSALSASSIRQQFSSRVNIALSQWSVAFMRRVGDELAIGDERPQIGLVEPGYLYLATAAGADAMQANHAVQRAAGADVHLLSPQQLQQRFGWLCVDDLALGAWGASGEGWFDGPALMQAFRRKAMACGAHFVSGEACGFATSADRVLGVRCITGECHEGDAVVLAAGAWSQGLSAQLGMPLPVSPKKRDVFVLDSPAALPGCPLVIDPGGVWFRPEGRGFIAGAPPRSDEADEEPLECVDHALFDELIWPALAARVPAFEALRVRSCWAGYYEMNAFDHNGYAGRLPGWRNAYAVCGFSGHGMQHAPAVGCAMAAMLVGAHSDAPALDALAPVRLAENRPLIERQVI